MIAAQHYVLCHPIHDLNNQFYVKFLSLSRTHFRILEPGKLDKVSLEQINRNNLTPNEIQS